MEKIKIITHGKPSIEDLSENEKISFYIAMLTQILELHRMELERKEAE